MDKSARDKDAGLTQDELWEIDCLQKQFPEHSYEEIVWAFENCRKQGKDPATLEKCVKRKLQK